MAFAAYAPRSTALGAPWGQLGDAPLAGSRAAEVPDDLTRLLRDLIERYPVRRQAAVRQEVPRTAFLLGLVARAGTSLLEIGGGTGLLALGAASLGVSTWIARDPSIPLLPEVDLGRISARAGLSLRVLSGPAPAACGRVPEASMDVVAWASVVERSQHAPRAVLAEAFRALRPGGTLLLAAPNGASAGRRLRALAGRGAGMRFEEWYYPDEANGPVREPVLEDLRRMTRELGFECVSVHGRCFAGRGAGRAGRALVAVGDRLLRPLPTLCGDLALLAVRP